MTEMLSRLTILHEGHGQIGGSEINRYLRIPSDMLRDVIGNCKSGNILGVVRISDQCRIKAVPAAFFVRKIIPEWEIAIKRNQS